MATPAQQEVTTSQRPPSPHRPCALHRRLEADLQVAERVANFEAAATLRRELRNHSCDT